MKKILFSIIILLILILYSSVYTISENEYGIITRFGEIKDVIYKAGLYYKLPYDKINRLQKQKDIFKTPPIQLLLGDKNPLIITCFVCWKIETPVLFFKALSTKQNAERSLNDMINSKLGSILGEYSLENIINTDKKKLKLKAIEDVLTKECNSNSIKKYGIKINMIGIRRINYPSIVAESVYTRMRAERAKEAKKYRAEGMKAAAKIEAEADRKVAEIEAEATKKSEIIKGEGDRKAIEIYSKVYTQNPELFEFLKSLETYNELLKNKSTVILSTESDILKFLNKFKISDIKDK